MRLPSTPVIELARVVGHSGGPTDQGLARRSMARGAASSARLAGDSAAPGAVKNGIRKARQFGAVVDSRDGVLGLLVAITTGRPTSARACSNSQTPALRPATAAASTSPAGLPGRPGQRGQRMALQNCTQASVERSMEARRRAG